MISPDQPSPPMRRIAVVGVTGAGKTTLAQELARRLGLPHIEMDALNWQADWQMAPTELLREQLAAALSSGGWVVDGNYGKTRDLVWGQADTLIWLDYPLILALWRMVSRTLRRAMRREVLWNGNRERPLEVFFSRDGLILYLFQSHGRLRRSYPRLLDDSLYRHLRLVRLRSPREAARWLATVPEDAHKS